MHPHLNALEEHTATARYAVCRTASCVMDNVRTLRVGIHILAFLEFSALMDKAFEGINIPR